MSASRTWAINAGQPGGSEQCHRRTELETGLRRMKAKAQGHPSHLRVANPRGHLPGLSDGALLRQNQSSIMRMRTEIRFHRLPVRRSLVRTWWGLISPPLPVNSHRTVLESLGRGRDIQDIVLHVNPKPAYLPVGAQDSGRGEPPGSDCPSLALSIGDPTGPLGASGYWSRI